MPSLASPWDQGPTWHSQLGPAPTPHSHTSTPPPTHLPQQSPFGFQPFAQVGNPHSPSPKVLLDMALGAPSSPSSSKGSRGRT